MTDEPTQDDPDIAGAEVTVGDPGDTDEPEEVGDLMDEDDRSQAEEAAAKNPGPQRRAALAEIDPSDVTPQMIDHDVRFDHLTDEMKQNEKELRGFSTGETPPPDPDGDHNIALNWGELDVDVSEDAGEPLKEGDETEILQAAGMAGQPSESEIEADTEDHSTGTENSEDETPDPDATAPVGESSASPPASDTSDSTADSGEDDDPEPQTLTDTGLLDDDEQFPWEGEEVVDKAEGGEERVEFTYLRIPFEIEEPDDPQRLENARGMLEGVMDQNDRERRRTVQRYFGKLADETLSVDGTSHEKMYAVERPDGRRDILNEQTAAKHGLIATDSNDARATTDGGTTVAEELGVTVNQLWDALTPFQRQKLGQKMDRFTSGEDSFRPRFD